jgi:hypothetical protein
MNEIVFISSKEPMPSKTFEFLCVGKIPKDWAISILDDSKPIFFNIKTRELFISRCKLPKGTKKNK